MQILIDAGLAVLYFCFLLLLGAWTWRFWKMYVNQKFLNSLDWVMLEIKLPREITKSPLATEVALASLLQGGGIGDAYSRNYKGGLPAYSSLEIASLEGVVHFYIRTQKKFKPLVEANFYAQYPEIEIVEAEDYTKLIQYHHLSKDVKCWSSIFKTSKTWNPTNPENGKAFQKDGKDYSMKADFLPIKTYVDYGLEKDPKEEFKTDPITPLLEMMGGLGKGEYLWYQILVQDESVYDKKMPKFYVNEVTHDHVTLKSMADARKKQIRTASWNIKGEAVKSEFGIPTMIDVYDKDLNQKFKETTEGEKVIRTPEKVVARHLETKAVGKKEMELIQEEKDEIELINKKLSKPLALCVMRMVYVARSESYKPAGNINNILSYPKPFSGPNSLAPSPADSYSYPWQNVGGKRGMWRNEEMFEEFVEREGFFPHVVPRNSLDEWEDRFFFPSSMKQRKLFRMIYEAIFHPFDHPHAEQAFVLNLEELATLWHLPGAVAGTPTLPRIDSAKGVAPVNLPL